MVGADSWRATELVAVAAGADAAAGTADVPREDAGDKVIWVDTGDASRCSATELITGLARPLETRVAD